MSLFRDFKRVFGDGRGGGGVVVYEVSRSWIFGFEFCVYILELVVWRVYCIVVFCFYSY